MRGWRAGNRSNQRSNEPKEEEVVVSWWSLSTTPQTPKPHVFVMYCGVSIHLASQLASDRHGWELITNPPSSSATIPVRRRDWAMARAHEALATTRRQREGSSQITVFSGEIFFLFFLDAIDSRWRGARVPAHRRHRSCRRGRGQGDTVEARGRVPCAHRNTGRRSGDGDVRRRRTGLARRGRGGRRQ